MSKHFFAGIIFFSFLCMIAGCGGGGGGNTAAVDTNPVSQEQANAIGGQISKAAVNGMMNWSAANQVSGMPKLESTMDCELCSTNPSIVPKEQVHQNTTMESNADAPVPVVAAACNTYQINLNFNHKTNCTSGGYISVLGDASGYINSCGSASIQAQITESIVNWQCTGDWTVDGDPNLSVVATFAFDNNLPKIQQNMTISGGFKMDKGC